MPQESPPDIVLFAVEWQPRALIRAQLLEDGLTVVATDTWPMMRRHLRPGSKPRLAIVDLSGLPNPEGVLNDLRLLMKPDRVLVLTAIGTVETDTIERLGFQVLTRPIAIKDIVATAVHAIRDTKQPTEDAEDAEVQS
jgi:hypothetical protein